MNRRKLPSLFLLGLLLLGFVASFPLIANASGEAWLTGYASRKAIDTGFGAGTGSDYALRFLVYNSSGTDSNRNIYIGTTGSLSANFGDIRFTDSTGTTELSYWRQQYSATVGVFWVEVPSDITSSSVTIFMYYGKSGVATTGSVENTFPLGAEFNGAIESGWTWTNEPDSPASWSVSSNDYLRMSSGGENVDIWNDVDTGYQLLKSSPLSSNYEIVTKYATSFSAAYHNGGIIVKQDSNDWFFSDIGWSATAGTHRVVVIAWDDAGTSTSQTIQDNTAATYIVTQNIGGTYKVGYSTDGLSYTISSSWSKTKTISPMTVGLFLKTATTTSCYIDYYWVFMKKYASVEPTCTVTGTDSAPNGLFVFRNTSDVDGSASLGTHSNFTAQKYYDSSLDTVTEGIVSTTISNDEQNWVDDNTSDVDSHADHGTSSNFAEQQTSDSTYDTLTEDATAGGSNSTLWSSGFETGDLSQWDGNGATSWTADGGVITAGTNLEGWTGFAPNTGTYAIGTGATGDGYLYSDTASTAGLTKFYINFWYATDDGDGGELVVYGRDITGAYTQIGGSYCAGAEDTWTFVSIEISGAGPIYTFAHANFHLSFLSANGNGEAVYLDDVSIIIYNAPTNYELDYEFQFTTATYNRGYEYLAIRTGTLNAEAIYVDVRNGGAWTRLMTLSASAWNNVSISDYLTSATITFRFLGGSESSDAVLSTWQIESTLIHTYDATDYYGLDIEEQVIDIPVPSEYDNELMCVNTGSYTDAETLTVQAWDGDSWETVTSLTASQWNNVSVSSFLTQSYFTFRLIDATGDTTQSAWQIESILLWLYDDAEGGTLYIVATSVNANFNMETDADTSYGIAMTKAGTFAMATDADTSYGLVVSKASTYDMEAKPSMAYTLTLTTSPTFNMNLDVVKSIQQAILHIVDVFLSATFNMDGKPSMAYVLTTSLASVFTLNLDVLLRSVTSYIVDLVLGVIFNMDLDSYFGIPPQSLIPSAHGYVVGGLIGILIFGPIVAIIAFMVVKKRGEGDQ